MTSLSPHVGRVPQQIGHSQGGQGAVSATVEYNEVATKLWRWIAELPLSLCLAPIHSPPGREAEGKGGAPRAGQGRLGFRSNGDETIRRMRTYDHPKRPKQDGVLFSSFVLSLGRLHYL